MDFIPTIAIILGLIFGSFLNVVIYRLPKKIFFSKARSFCPKCNYQIPINSNIPIFSFLIQRGKCKNCDKKISYQYPIIELISSSIWFWASISYDIQQGILFIWICSILLTITIIDFKTLIIPFPLIISAFLGILTYLLINPTDWKISFWGTVMGVGYLSLVFLLTSALFKKQTMGFGDLQLVAITGMWLGPINILLSIFISALLALIFWIVLVLFNGKDKHTMIPFGPFLSFSAILLYILDMDLLKYL